MIQFYKCLIYQYIQKAKIVIFNESNIYIFISRKKPEIPWYLGNRCADLAAPLNRLLANGKNIDRRGNSNVWPNTPVTFNTSEVRYSGDALSRILMANAVLPEGTIDWQWRNTSRCNISGLISGELQSTLIMCSSSHSYTIGCDTTARFSTLQAE